MHGSDIRVDNVFVMGRDEKRCFTHDKFDIFSDTTCDIRFSGMVYLFCVTLELRLKEIIVKRNTWIIGENVQDLLI